MLYTYQALIAALRLDGDKRGWHGFNRKSKARARKANRVARKSRRYNLRHQ